MESFNDSISAYDKIFNKYNLSIVKNYRNTNSTNKELDELINHLSMERVVSYQKKNTISLKDRIVYLSDRLLNFLFSNDYIIDSAILYEKLYNRLFTLTDYYNFSRIKKIDMDMYNELLLINKSYSKSKNNLLKEFIEKYTSNNESIKIKI
jgi:hypothetical protein